MNKNSFVKTSAFTAEDIAASWESCMSRDMRTVIKTMELGELQQVAECEEIPYPLRSFAEWLWGKRIMDPKPVEKNLPVKHLINLFCDKKSKMVQLARKQLLERFKYLSYDEQMSVLRNLLAFGTFNDAIFCAEYLLDDMFWTDDKKTIEFYQEDISRQFLKAIEARKEATYKLSQLVAQRMPKDFVLMRYDEVKSDTCFPERYIILRNLLTRLAEDKRFELDKSILSASDYARICYRNDREITDQEAEEALYMNIVDRLNSSPIHHILAVHDRWHDLEFLFYDEYLMKAVSSHKEVLIDYIKWKAIMYKSVEESNLDEFDSGLSDILIAALPKKYRKLIR